jgi:tetratricopeptide (TPR) repeat protein
MHYNLGQALFWQRRYADAAAETERALRLDRGFAQAATLLALIDVAEARTDSAVSRLRAVAAETQNLDDVAMLGYGYAAAGKRDSAAVVLGTVRDALRDGHHVSAADIALVYVALGRSDEAFAWLERARELHDSDLQAFIQAPMLDPLRGDRRFDALLRGLRLRD